MSLTLIMMLDDFVKISFFVYNVLRTCRYCMIHFLLRINILVVCFLYWNGNHTIRFHEYSIIQKVVYHVYRRSITLTTE